MLLWEAREGHWGRRASCLLQSSVLVGWICCGWVRMMEPVAFLSSLFFWLYWGQFLLSSLWSAAVFYTLEGHNQIKTMKEQPVQIRFSTISERWKVREGLGECLSKKVLTGKQCEPAFGSWDPCEKTSMVACMTEVRKRWLSGACCPTSPLVKLHFTEKSHLEVGRSLRNDIWDPPLILTHTHIHTHIDMCTYTPHISIPQNCLKNED